MVEEINVSAHRRRFLLTARRFPATGSSVCVQDGREAKRSAMREIRVEICGHD